MKRGAIAVIAVLLLLLGGPLLVAKYRASQLDMPSLVAAGDTIVLASDGKRLGSLASAESGKALKSQQISVLIRHVHMAAEDRSFYQHGAISLPGLATAMFANAKARAWVAGGSTITQQYAKRLAGSDRTVKRKFNEAAYAYRLEQDYTKDQILEMYVNSNYYGRGTYSVDDAARTWFGVSAAKLTDMNNPKQVARAAFLAGLIKAPGDYEAYRGQPSNLVLAKEVRNRTLYVLDGLRDLKGLPQGQEMVSQKTVDQAKALLADGLDGLGLTNRIKRSGRVTTGDPYLMNYIVREWLVAWQTELARQDGLEGEAADKEGRRAVGEMMARGGLTIKTSIDRRIQDMTVKAHKALLGNPSGVVVLNPRDGGVVAMSGGRNYSTDANNYAVYASRPPGSTMKPFVLANAVKEGISPMSVFGAPRNIKIDGPAIWDHTRKDAPGCKMTLVDGLAVSHNVVYTEAATGKMASCKNRNKLTDIKGYPVTPESVADLLHEVGVDASLVPGRDAPVKIGEAPRVAIGDTLEVSPLKLAVMDATLATGKRHKPYLVSEITTSDTPIFEHEEESDDVFEEDHTNIINQAMTTVYTRGTAQGAQVSGHPLAGKTGTTDTNQGDSWMVAHNAVNPKHDDEPAYVCAAWQGKNPNSAGADVARVCQRIFSGALEGRKRVPFPKADLNEGKKVGLDVGGEAPPPPPPPPTTEAPPPPPTETPEATEPPKSEPTDKPSKNPASPTVTPRPKRSIPPPEDGTDQVNTGTVEVPGLPVG